MGLVTEKLIELIHTQVEEHGVVVWCDPQGEYKEVARDLNLPETRVFPYDPEQGYLALRRELEPFWGGDSPPRLVIYVPRSRQEATPPLVEYITAGVCLHPGGHPPERNTRLSVVVQRALEGVCPAATLAQYVQDVEAGKLNLEEVDRLAENCKDLQIGTLSIIFGTSNPEEIALRFLSTPSLDDAITEKQAGLDLANLLQSAYGYTFPAAPALPALRARFARYILATDLRASLGGDSPESLQAVPPPPNEMARDSTLQLARLWRSRIDLSEAYLRTATQVEAEFNLEGQAWTLEALQECTTFQCLETELQTLVEARLIEKPEIALISLARQRRDGFWAANNPEIKLRWEIIAAAGEIILGARNILRALKGKPLAAQEILRRYTTGESPWCALDSAYRHMERDVHYLDLQEDRHDSLLRLIAVTRQTYTDAVDRLAQAFVHACEQAGLELPGVVQQIDIFHDFVAPSLPEGKTAYLLVDALRYEMARELQKAYLQDWETTLVPALAVPPTMTRVGMAALLPGAQQGIGLEISGSGRLAAIVGGESLKTRAQRIAFLKKNAGVPTEVVRLDQIAPLNPKTCRQLEEARLIVVTASEEIDGLWENSPEMARRLQDHVFDQLRRGIRNLFSLGVQRLVVTADHGFLLGEGLAPGEGIDAPGGQTAELHRRVWIGKGGAHLPNCLRKPLSAFGVSGDAELVTPYGLAIFKVPGGSLDYFHGGLSPQEWVIPVLVCTGGKDALSPAEPAFRWQLIPGSQKITSPFISVTVAGSAPGMFQEPPRIRPELRVGDQIISQPVSAKYGFDNATRDVKMEFDPAQPTTLRENTVTLRLAESLEATQAILLLLDAETGSILTDPITLPIDML